MTGRAIERLQQGIEGSGSAVWELNLATRELVWSKTTRELFGLQRRTADRASISSCRCSIRRTATASSQAVQRSIESGDNFNVEVPRRAPPPAASTGCEPAAAWSGPTTARRAIWAASCFDIDEEKQLEQALRTAAEPAALDPRHRAGRDDRDRRPRHHAVLLQRGRAAVRLHRSAKRSASNISELMPGPDRARHDNYLDRYKRRPASATSSASAGSSPASAGTARPFRSICRSARCSPAASAISPASSAISPNISRPRRGCTNCSPNWSTSRG